MTQRVLLVGATSPIGGAIAAELDRRGVATARTSRLGGPGVARLDVDDEREVQAVLSTTKPNTIVYLASPRGDLSEQVKTALRSLRRFTDQAVEAGAQSLIFASSAAVYGTTHSAPRREDDPLEPQSQYAQMKVDAEVALAESSANLGIGILSLRVFNVYGPRLDSSLINRMFLRQARPPEVFSTSRFIRDYVHVSDVARAFAAGVASAPVGFAAVNVGTGVGVDNLTLLAQPGVQASGREVPPGFLSCSVAATAKMRTVLEVNPRIFLDDVVRTADSLLS